MNILVTGGCGFIGSNFVNYMTQVGYNIVGVVDKMTYAADANNLTLPTVIYKFDIYNVNWVSLLEKTRADIIVHFAAESHVDRSIKNAVEFIKTNDAAVYKLTAGLSEYNAKHHKKVFLLHISTDEVLGSLGEEEKPWTEDAKLNPKNPYASTKAAAETMIQAMHNTTHGFDYTIARAVNNYGPNQNFEKFLPTIIRSAMLDQEIPVYGKGLQSREWLYVLDFIRGLELILKNYATQPASVVSQIFHFGSSFSVKNAGLVKFVLNKLKKPDSLIKFVLDRPGHDSRYSLNWFKAKTVLEWAPTMDFSAGVDSVIKNVEIRLFGDKSDSSW